MLHGMSLLYLTQTKMFAFYSIQILMPFMLFEGVLYFYYWYFVRNDSSVCDSFLRPLMAFIYELLASWSNSKGAYKSLAQPGRKQANVSVRMAWVSFVALPCMKKTWWQLESRCCWNHARPWHVSELVSFLVGLRTYQHPTKVMWCYRSSQYIGGT